MQSHSFPTKCGSNRVAEEQAELPEHPHLLHVGQFCCQHSSYMNIDKADDEGASRCMDRLATRAQKPSRRGPHSTAGEGGGRFGFARSEKAEILEKMLQTSPEE